jgi:cell division protein ZapE
MMSSEATSSALPHSPLELYRQDLDRGIITADESQRAAIFELERLYEHLVARWTAKPGLSSWLGRCLGLGRGNAEPGLYLWGGVGRGKTYLMDLFFHALPGERKMRMHFHRFMLMVHRLLLAQKGRSDPLLEVAAELAEKVDVLCFDEFHVADIGDAMILANLLEGLFERGVMLVATSNIVPDRLYERGLQRQQFLPAIALIERHTRVLNVDGGTDYRLRSLDKVAVYLQPLDTVSAATLEALFNDLTRGLHVTAPQQLEINGRRMDALRWSEGLVWFDFETLCGGPRSAADYIELGRQYHTVFVSGLPWLEESADDKARRFITMVDEFYDHRVKLVLSAAGELDHIYRGTELGFPFARTRSRLLEMQTREYLGSQHRPD